MKRLELNGQRFGKLIVLDVDPSRSSAVYWKCICDCGKIISTMASSLTQGNTKSCGCLRNRSKRRDLVGKRSGKLTVISFSNMKFGQAYWNCLCDCGKKTIVVAHSVASGNSKSCGCGRGGVKKKRPIPSGVLFDPEDFDIVNAVNWSIDVQGYVSNRNHNLLLHRVVMKAKPEDEVDHISGNRLDNRKRNLRLVPRYINSQNQTRLNKRNTSGYRGVSYDKSRNKWSAGATLYYKKIHLGRYDTAEEAHAVASAWRLKNMEAYYSLEKKDET